MQNTSREEQHAIVQQALADCELFRALIDQLDAGIYIVDRDRRILYWNGGAERITGYLAHEVAGQLCHGDLLMHCDSEGAVLCGSSCPVKNVMQDSKPRECVVFLRHRQGHRLPVHVRARSIYDSHGQVVGAVEVFEEALAPARKTIGELKAFGCLDELTGAASRHYGEMRIRQAVQALDEFGIPFGWMRIGLDSTELLEQRFGHGLIDAAMKMIHHTVDVNLGSLDVLTRWSKAEFRVEVHYSSRLELADTAEKLVTLVRVSALDWWGDRLRLTVSVGAGTAERGDTLESLEARVAGVFESCRAGGGDRAAVAHTQTSERNACLP
jgi:PAS domain S-box-containing protein/diguanylate cyclase (GGDEF)-like protein